MAGKAWWFFTRLTYAACVCCGNLRSDQTGQQRLCPVVLEQLARKQVCTSPGPQGARVRTGCPLWILFFPPTLACIWGSKQNPLYPQVDFVPRDAIPRAPATFPDPSSGSMMLISQPKLDGSGGVMVSRGHCPPGTFHTTSIKFPFRMKTEQMTSRRPRSHGSSIGS